MSVYTWMTTKIGKYYPGIGTQCSLQQTEISPAILSYGTSAPTNGASGTGVGVAGPGAFYINTTNATGTVYVNQGTMASPTWNLLETAGSANNPVTYWADTGTANTYAITPSPAVVGYVAGQTYLIKIKTTNTGASTLNVNGLGTKAIQFMSAALTAGALVANTIVMLSYDGTQFELLSQVQDFVDPGYLVDSGSANTYAITVVPAPAAYVAGQSFRVNITHASTGASTLQVNSLGTKNILQDGAALVANSLVANGIYDLVYDGTQFNVVGTSIGTGKVTAAKLATVTDGSTLDQSGAGSTLEVKSGGVALAQLASGVIPVSLTASCKKPAIAGIMASGLILPGQASLTQINVLSGVLPATSFSFNVARMDTGATLFSSGQAFAALNNCAKAITFAAAGSTYTDITTSVNGAGAVGALSGMLSTGFVYLGFASPFAAWNFVATANVNSNASVLSAKYWNGSAWTSVTITDGSASAGATFAQTGVISWTPPGVWQTTSVNSSAALYFIQFAVTATLSASVDIGTTSGGVCKLDTGVYYPNNFSQNSTAIPAGTELRVACTSTDATADKVAVQIIGTVK